MTPNARLRAPRDRTRKFRWPFARKRNRRVRPPSLVVPVAGREPTGTGETDAAPKKDPSGAQATVRPKPPRRKRPWIVLGLLVVAGGCVFGTHRFVTRSKHFVVRTLRFNPLRHVAAESLQARAGLALGGNLFSIDLNEIERKVLEEPWVKEAHARRELPSTIAVDVVEREATSVIALNTLYLADPRGVVFKRANPEEAASLPVVTGIERESYLGEPEQARAHVREALATVAAWGSARPALGEVHWDRLLGITVYTREGAVGVRLGRADDAATLNARLHRFDVVWAELAKSGERPRVIYLDNRARPDRVTVKLASPPVLPAAEGGKRT
jgi:cell division protein FtsQ